MNKSSKIVDEKQRVLNNFRETRNKLLKNVFLGFFDKSSIAKISNNFISSMPNSNREMKKSQKKMITTAYHDFTRRVKKDESNDPSKILDLLLLATSSMGMWQGLRSVETQRANQIESEQKSAYIEITIGEQRELQHPQVFYICSRHNDCADDHIAFQGKIYIDEKYKQTLKNYPEELVKVEDYVRANSIEYLQKITHKPVWLVTRPNCRHYIEAVKTEQVLTLPVDKILKGKNMSHSYWHNRNKQDIQTISHSRDKGWYTADNIKSIISQYEDRLAYHEAMRDSYIDHCKKNNLPVNSYKKSKIQNFINKDKYLIAKWKHYLSTI